MVADLYDPKIQTGKLPEIAISGPFGAVKGQSSGLYAQTMAERGFLTIAFDPSFTGESGGFPRNGASGDVNTVIFLICSISSIFLLVVNRIAGEHGFAPFSHYQEVSGFFSIIFAVYLVASVCFFRPVCVQKS